MRFIGYVCALALAVQTAEAQETRGAIFGRVLDPQDAAVVAAAVVARNVETNIRATATSNETGYFELPLLLPGNYAVEVEAAGFKKTVRTGIVLPVGSRVEVGVRLEIGSASESISVTAEAPLLETNSVSAGRIIDNRTIMSLPVMSNSIALVSQFSAGVSTSGNNQYHQVIAIGRASDYTTAGGVGGNEWSIDGAPNNGRRRWVSMAPVTDTIQEMKVETMNFDAAVGHSTGINFAMMSRAGTNDYHGNLTWQHWQQRWQGTPFFQKQLYYRRISEAETAGNTVLANQLRNTDKQASGRSNTYAGTVGGPITIPKLVNGRNRLFFFFSFNGFKDAKPVPAANLNVTLPTMAARMGDFSRMLQIGPQYQLHDPLSVRPDPGRATHVIRDPLPGNIVPRSRMINPMYEHYAKFLPATNNEPANARAEPLNTFIAANMPFNWEYKSFTNRVDYQVSDRHRLFGRVSYGRFFCDEYDWTWQTERGLHLGCQARWSRSGMIDYTWVKSASTIVNVMLAANQYREGATWTKPQQFPPSKVGLPAYLDQRAGSEALLPRVNVAGYMPISHPGFQYNSRFTTYSIKSELSHVHGNHTVRAGIDFRQQMYTGGGGGNTSGAFTFDNSFTRKDDDGLVPAGSLGHSWAAFLMGVPSRITLGTEDNFVATNPYYGWFAQDAWRVNRKLTVNFGLRMEYELGPIERFNRLIGRFDPALVLPITQAAQAAYARNPLPELAASSFRVLGGSTYPNVNGVPRRIWRNELMFLPRASFAYQATQRTVVRAGYGIYYDTMNVLNEGPTAASWLQANSAYTFPEDRTGFARETVTVPTNDFGLTWNTGNPARGISPVTDPFPLRADGTRFNVPVGSALGPMARAGQGWNFIDFDRRHARQQRWRAGLQRQLGSHMILDAAYAGSYSDRVPLAQAVSALPANFWADGMARNDALASNMNSNVTNPFHISHFGDLARTDPIAYQNISTQPFFQQTIIRKNQLLRPNPQMNGLVNRTAHIGAVRTHSFEVSFERRFQKGFNFHTSYTRMYNKTADFFWNEFDAAPSWRESNVTRPHRFTFTTVAELPFGKGRAFLNRGLLSHVVGGFQVAATYEYQPGALLDFGNLFYYGEFSEILSGERTLERWFNTANFERVPARTPAAFHRRVFPTRIDGLRADRTNHWNANLQREFAFHERLRLQIRMDAFNLQNRSQFAAPNVNPVSTDFGRVVSQSPTTNRFLQVQARLVF